MAVPAIARKAKAAKRHSVERSVATDDAILLLPASKIPPAVSAVVSIIFNTSFFAVVGGLTNNYSLLPNSSYACRCGHLQRRRLRSQVRPLATAGISFILIQS